MEELVIHKEKILFLVIKFSLISIIVIINKINIPLRFRVWIVELIFKTYAILDAPSSPILLAIKTLINYYYFIEELVSHSSYYSNDK